jgi:hypothetical protein
VHVVVVDLLGEFARSDRTGVQVKSDKGEREPIVAAVGADVLALTEPHVRLVRQRRSSAGDSVCSSPPPRMCVRPTNPSKSVIWDGSLMSATGTPGFSGL